MNELDLFKDTIEYAVAQFIKAWNLRQSTTDARQYINRMPMACQREANRLITEHTKTNSPQRQTNQSYR